MGLFRKIIVFSIIILIILGGFSFVRAAFNEKINYQGKLTGTDSVAVSDGAYDIVFNLYTAGGGGAAIWTESWTNAALWTEASMTFTNDGCAGGVDKVAYTTAVNEGSLAAGQYLWNTTKKESALIQSVDAGNNWVCVYDTPSAWAMADGATNRIYVKNGLFSAMLGSVSSLSAIDLNQTLYLGVTVGTDSEMKPRKMIGAVPAAFEAKQLGGATWAAPSAIGSGTANTGAFTGLTSSGNSNFSSDAGSLFAFGNTTGAATLQSGGVSSWANTSGNLSISTLTSGTLGLTSAGALNLSAAAASTWTLPSVVNALNFDSDTLTIDASNNRVGIGTAAPGYKLHIEQSALGEGNIVDYLTLGSESAATGIAGDGMGIFFRHKNTENTLFQSRVASVITAGGNGSDLTFGTALPSSGPSEKMRILSSGNVGIGTTIPTGNLTVAQSTTGVGTVSNAAGGTTVTGVGTQFTNTFKIGDTITINGETVAISTIASDTSMTTAAITNLNSGVAYTLVGGARLAVLGNGNVGIGTATPGGILDISESKPASYSYFVHRNTATVDVANQVVMEQRLKTSVQERAAFQINTSFNTTTDASRNSLVNFYTANAGTWGSAMAINGGNVGIGTATPATKLEIATNNAIKIGNAYVSDGFGGSNIATNAWYNGSSWQVPDAVNKSTLVQGYLGELYFFRTTTAGSDAWQRSMTILNSGNVGIGIDSPTANFAVAQGTTGIGTVSNAAGGTTVTGIGTQFLNTFKVGDTITIGGQTVAISAIASDTSMTTAAITNLNSGVAYTLVGGTRMAVLGNGNVGIGTTAPGQALDVTGTIRQSACKTAGTLSANTSGDIICTSDENLKNIYGYYEDGLSTLFAINPIRFSYKGEEFIHVGFSAQNVKSVLPEASALQDSGYWSLDTTSVIALTVNAIKEQQKQIEDLKLVLNQNGNIANSDGEAIVASLGQDQNFIDLVKSTVREALASLSGTVMAAGEWTFEKITAKKLCVEDVCVDRDQLKNLLDKNQNPSQPASVPIIQDSFIVPTPILPEASESPIIPQASEAPAAIEELAPVESLAPVLPPAGDAAQ